MRTPLDRLAIALPFGLGGVGLGLATGVILHDVVFSSTYGYSKPMPWGLPWRFGLMLGLAVFVVALVIRPEVPKPLVFGSLGTAIVGIWMAGAIWLGLVANRPKVTAVLGIMALAVSLTLALYSSGVPLTRSSTDRP